MTTKIRQTFLLWHAADGEQLQYIVDRGGRSDEGNCEKLHSLKKPVTPVSMQLLLEDDRLITLPFNDFAWILPDRTGVLVIFKPGSYTHPDGNDVFPFPNNAAIYNADGSLRFQLKVMDPRVHHIHSMHGGSLPKKFDGMLGVLVAFSEDDTPAWAYAVNPVHPELIDALQWVRY